MHPLIKEVEKRFLKKHEDFRVGDTIRVHLEIVEGNKKRIQLYEGILMSRRGTGTGASITVRKNSSGVAVEKIIPLCMPSVARIEVVRKGMVRRDKQYYLKRTVGKGTRVKEDLSGNR